MSTELKTVKSDHSNAVNLTQHSGGQQRGCIVSLTQKSPHYKPGDAFYPVFQGVELDRQQAVEVVAALTEWLANGAANFVGHS